MKQLNVKGSDILIQCKPIQQHKYVNYSVSNDTDKTNIMLSYKDYTLHDSIFIKFKNSNVNRCTLMW